MKAANFFKMAVVASVVVASGFLTSTSPNAATGTIGSSVTIGTAISVAGINNLNWGVMAAPTGAPDAWVMDPAGNLSGGTPAYDLFAADHNAGMFTITGEGAATTNYSVVVSTDFADAALSLSDLTLDPITPSDLSGGTLDVNVGGTLTISLGATPGLHNDAVITMTANY